MTNPYRAPVANSETPGAARSRFHTLDRIAFALCALPLLYAMLLHSMLWGEYLAGQRIYDPAAGGDPVWQQRPKVVPALVLVVALSRWLARARRRPTTALEKAYLGLAILAAACFAAAFIPEPSFFGPE